MNNFTQNINARLVIIYDREHIHFYNIYTSIARFALSSIGGELLEREREKEKKR